MKRNPFLYYGKKLLVFLLSVLILSVLVFYISRLAPGDPLMSYYGERTEKMSVEEKEAAREKLGLNEPIRVQYLRWVGNALRGDFGISYKYKQPVTTVIAQRMGNTLILGGIGFVLTFAGALGLGILCAWQEDRPVDRILCKGGTVLSCIPEFWLSLMLILIFSVYLKILPSSGAYDVGYKDDFGNRALHLLLPMTVVVLEHLWYYAGGNPGGLRAAGQVQGTVQGENSSEALPAERHARLYQPDGHLRAPHSGGHLHCGNRVQLSRNRQTVLRKRPVPRLQSAHAAVHADGSAGDPRKPCGTDHQ